MSINPLWSIETLQGPLVEYSIAWNAFFLNSRVFLKFFSMGDTVPLKSLCKRISLSLVGNRPLHLFSCMALTRLLNLSVSDFFHL